MTLDNKHAGISLCFILSIFTMLMRYGLNCFIKSSFKNFFTIILAVLIVSALFLVFINISFHSYIRKNPIYRSFPLNSMKCLPKIIFSNTTIPSMRNNRCCYYSCFNTYRCGHNGEQNIRIYVYPFVHYSDELNQPINFALTKEFYIILQTIIRSKYYTSNPEEACIFVPSIDTLNQNNISKEVYQSFTLLPYWNNGENHLIFNMIPSKRDLITGLRVENAIIAASGFDSWTYRPSFDISLPLFNPLINTSHYKYTYNYRLWFIISLQLDTYREYKDKLIFLSEQNPDLHVMESCLHSDNLTNRCYNNVTYKYQSILQNSVFCIILRSRNLVNPLLYEALSFGCIPIIIADTIIMPFQEIIDWKRAALFIPEDYIYSVVEVAKSVSEDRRHEMSSQCMWLYRKYFSSIQVITNVTLEILNQRVFPEHATFYEEWNLPPRSVSIQPPLFLRTRTSRSQGFTAVILAYDRIESLFLLVKRLSLVPSLSKILVVWNNQEKSPPHMSEWPVINAPLEIIRTKANKLSNRFYPYKQIETDAVLSLDDDIVMLTADELDFGFEVWREFPDRLVGFPSRTHVWDNVTNGWKYDSEWTNEISMVLTGAAFYHKYWNHLYTVSMPEEIRNWVDERMNCEDIAMNFLVSNVTNKAPIKVAPRKKFKCPECTNTEMLSADLGHMVERSNCINKFAKVYGNMPLKQVEFRADPVLYKDSFPTKLKRYKNIGNL